MSNSNYKDKKLELNRRQVLKTMAVGASLTASSSLLSGCFNGIKFSQGVASGDPLYDRVILWTRVTPNANTLATVPVNWEVALDDTFTQVVSMGVTQTDPAKDFTVKVDASGLTHNTKYFYRFIADGSYSPVGQTRTLPQGQLDNLRLGVVSCASYPHGYFNVYLEMTRHDIDYVVHLGDYIYEYAPGDYDDGDDVAQKRMANPSRELLSLADYRLRYEQYRSDPDLKALHAQRPFICVWDDHEVANDAWREGAENHDDNTEGDYFVRRNQALKAYYEWMPIREVGDPLQIYRQFKFGDLLSLYMLDTRHVARDKQLSHLDYINNLFLSYDYEQAKSEIRSTQRTLLGTEQKEWLKDSLSSTTSTWNVFAQQILMGRMEVPWRLAAFFELGVDIFSDGDISDLLDPEKIIAGDLSQYGPRFVGYNLDAWDGYYAEREELLNYIKDLNLNFINLAGDTHNAWANNLQTQDGEAVGVELATASVASPGIADFLKGVPLLSTAFTKLIKQLKYANVYDRGFMILDINHDETVSEWIFVNTVKSKLFFRNFLANKKMKVRAGQENRRLENIEVK